MLNKTDKDVENFKTAVEYMPTEDLLGIILFWMNVKTSFFKGFETIAKDFYPNIDLTKPTLGEFFYFTIDELLLRYEQQGDKVKEEFNKKINKKISNYNFENKEAKEHYLYDASKVFKQDAHGNFDFSSILEQVKNKRKEMKK